MTIFVGPNNSGKSLILRELQQYSEQGPDTVRHIIEGIEINLPSDEETRTFMDSRSVPTPQTEVLREGFIRVTRPIPSTGSSANIDINLNQLLQQLETARTAQVDGNPDWWKNCWAGIYQQYTSLLTVALDGKTRLALTEQRQAGDLLAAPVNHLASLFVNDDARRRVRNIIHEAFGTYFVIDPTNVGSLRIKMSERLPADKQEEQGLDQRSREFHTMNVDIAQLSDGVKAFTGLISALISSDYRIMLVDEPEAFLHPPLARQLGREMATLAYERSGNVFASTHSAPFLMGCVDSGKVTNIVRLTYKGLLATARVLPSERIKELMRDPLLRSTRVLDALFNTGAVICESDVDRAFYDEVNNRLQMAGRNFVPDSVFINAQNKQTIRRIVGPLRQMGIPTVAVVDFDIIKDTDLRDLLQECFLPADIIQSLGQLRGNINTHFEKRNLDMKKGGINLLGGAEQESCQSLIDQLEKYGVFVVPHGEVESWLLELKITASKRNWLPVIFEQMKSDPDDPDYLNPGEGDVWGFLERMANWIRSEERYGMPRNEEQQNVVGQPA